MRKISDTSTTLHTSRPSPQLCSRRALLTATASVLAYSPSAGFAAPELPNLAYSTQPSQCFTLPFEYQPYPTRNDRKSDRLQVDVPVHIQAPALVLPDGAISGPPPVVVFSPGFLQSAASYAAFLCTLRDSGFIVVTYDKSFEELSVLVDDVDSAELLTRVVTAAGVRLGGAGRAGPCFLAGHSRGAKLSVLTASAASTAAAAATPIAAGRPSPEDTASVSEAGVQLCRQPTAAESRGHYVQPSAPRPPPQQQQPPLGPVSGLILLDPADGAFEPQDPDRFPSVLPALRNPPPALADLPVLLVGAGRGGDCVPRSKNYRAFFEACRSPSILVTLQDAGHLQFLDRSDRLQQAICAAGRGLSNARVAAASGHAVAAFVRGVAGAGAGVARGEDVEVGGSSSAPREHQSVREVARVCRESLGAAGLRFEVQVN